MGRINLSGRSTDADGAIFGPWIWKGPYLNGNIYKRGQAVESDGGSWVATKQTSSRPNATDGTWELVAEPGLDGKPGLVWTGAYDPGRNYLPTEAVYFGGSAYINIAPSRNIEPTNPAYWSILVRSLNPGGVLNLVIGPEDSIQEAIDTVADAGGGSVTLQAGTYEVDYDIQMRSLVHLRAEGYFTATIDFMGTPSSVVFEGEEIYTTGTVNAVAGSDLVTGLGTDFLEAVTPGQEIFIGGIFYPIMDVLSATELKVAMPVVANAVGAPCLVANSILFASVADIAFENSARHAIRTNYAQEVILGTWRTSLSGGTFEFKNSTNLQVSAGDGVGNATGMVFDNTHLTLSAAAGVVNTAMGAGIAIKNGSANISFRDGFFLGQAGHGIHVQDSGPILFSGVTVHRAGGDGIRVERSHGIFFAGTSSTEHAGDALNIIASAAVNYSSSIVGASGGVSIRIDSNSAQNILNGTNAQPSMGGILIDNGIDTMISGCLPAEINTGGGGAGTVASVVGRANQVSVDSTDPENPVVGLDPAVTASLVLADSAVQNLGDLGITATATELNYVDGVTSPIQTQLDSKQEDITGGATSIVTNNLTANRALVSTGAGKVGVSPITATELSYLSGLSENVQNALNPNLADVLANGNTATDISINLTQDGKVTGLDGSGFFAQDNAKYGYLYPDYLRFADTNTNVSVDLMASNLTGNRVLQLPDSDGTLALEDDLTISLDFIDEQTTTIKAPYNMQIDTVTAEAGTPTITVNGSPYTLGGYINQFDEIGVDAGAVDRLVNLNATKL